MELTLFIIMGILSAFFIVSGASYKKKDWIIIGLISLIILGFALLSSGLSIHSGWVVF